MTGLVLKRTNPGRMLSGGTPWESENEVDYSEITDINNTVNFRYVFYHQPNDHNFLSFWNIIKFLVSRIMYSSRSLCFFGNFYIFGTLGYPTKALEASVQNQIN